MAQPAKQHLSAPTPVLRTQWRSSTQIAEKKKGNSFNEPSHAYAQSMAELTTRLSMSAVPAYRPDIGRLGYLPNSPMYPPGHTVYQLVFIRALNSGRIYASELAQSPL